MKKISLYVLIVLIAVGFLGPIVKIEAQTYVQRWYFEKKASPENIVMGGYEFEASCRTVESRTQASLILRSCFRSPTRPTPTPQPATPPPAPSSSQAPSPATTTTTTSTNPNATPTPTQSPTNSNYHLLEPLPGIGENFNPGQPTALGAYLNTMIKIFIGLCAVLAVVMIVIGGIEYMGSELISSKESGRQRITGAIFGLILALGAYTLLFTINPDLLNTDFKIENATIQVELEPETGIAGTGANNKTVVLSGGIQLQACDGSQMVSVNLFGTSVRVYKGVAKSLERINTRWLAMPESSRYKVNSVSGYNCRTIAGNPGLWSAHAFGMALDINPSTNPFGKERKTDMPPSFYNLFISEGWGWGGNWSGVKDAMHFSKIPRAEGGNGVVEPY